MPNSIYGIWSTLRTAFSEINPFSQGSDLSAFDYLEERVRELEQEVVGLRRELMESGSVPSLESHQQTAATLYRQPLQQWPRHFRGVAREVPPTDVPSASGRQLRIEQRAEYRGFIPIEAASPRYEVSHADIPQQCRR